MLNRILLSSRSCRFINLSRFNLQTLLLNKLSTMTGEPAEKKLHGTPKIGTHNGSFHCDEVLACFLLKQLDQYKDAEVIRTRDPKLLDTCDIVVDVGGVYDPSKHRYDHHQRSFTDSMNSLWSEKKWVTKLSSAGLVYLHFGMDVISKILGLPTSDPVTVTIYDKMYENFMEEIDAIDNGINQSESEPRYRITSNLSSRVGHLNPKWNSKGMDEDVQFFKAMDLVGSEFLSKVTDYKETWLPARSLVLAAIKNRYNVDPSGQIICLEEGGCPWKDHLFTLEAELKVTPPILYALFTDTHGNWRVQCVSVSMGSFENRLSLKEEWRGVRDDELSEKSGIKGCIFVHTSGFIGGNKTYEGVLEMARQSINAGK
ncbi:MYG1 exonuclease [Aplysia californica]|uniref:MYG1 exonuclease n=1 Tax=Aplysia californica TaxID=6500 RepID=A0ABM0K8Z5_APLCA|nr:MYG1 exonuclease [Aplysia californica]